MMKKTIILGLIILICLSTFALGIENAQEGLEDNIKLSIYVNKGWNVIAAGIYALYHTDASEIKLDDIKAMYYYSNVQKSYIRIKPDMENDKVNNEERLLNNGITHEMQYAAMWVYSGKKGVLEYVTDDTPRFNDRKLRKGWNFVSMTVDMYNGNYNPGECYEGEFFSWNAIQGQCNFEKISFFNPGTQSWTNIDPDMKMECYDFDDFLGLGMLVKVSADCTLGKSDDLITPPPIPNSIRCEDTDGGINYPERGVAKTFSDDVDYALDSAGEFCDGNDVWESYCEDRDANVKQEVYNCPNGCQDGACIR